MLIACQHQLCGTSIWFGMDKELRNEHAPKKDKLVDALETTFTDITDIKMEFNIKNKVVARHEDDESSMYHQMFIHVRMCMVPCTHLLPLREGRTGPIHGGVQFPGEMFGGYV